jgi:3-keto-5-aminohexanoate cleavage enzyme
MGPLIIEAAITELASKEANPNVPYALDDIVEQAVESARAGAAIVHFHARDPDTGEQRWHDTDFYRAAFAAIGKECDAILYPTQPGSGLDRCPHVIALADDGLLDHATVDILPSHPAAADQDPNNEVMRALNDRGVAFSIGVRDTGNMRKIARYQREGFVGDNLQLKIFFDEDVMGPQPDARGILAYLDHLTPGTTCHWFTTLYRGRVGGCFRPLSMLAAAMGGHIRTGLGDMPMLDARRTYTNTDMVDMAAQLAVSAGRTVASAAEARDMLGIRPR